MSNLASDVIALAYKQQDRQNAQLDLIATALEAVAADMEGAGIPAPSTRNAAARLHGLALELAIGDAP